MAKCTREQLNKWNEKLINGFGFDLHSFLMSGDKKAVKSLKLDGGKTLQAKLEYTEVRENWKTVGVRPVLHLSIWVDCDTPGFMKSSGLGVDVVMGDMQPRKNFDLLCKLSGTITDEEILRLANENMKQLNNPFVFA